MSKNSIEWKLTDKRFVCKFSDWTKKDQKLLKKTNHRFWVAHLLNHLKANHEDAFNKIIYLTDFSGNEVTRSFLAAYKGKVCIACKARFCTTHVCAVCKAKDPELEHRLRFEIRGLKSKQTSLAKYGVPHYTSTVAYQEEARKRALTTDYTERNAKSKATSLLKYGVEYPNQTLAIRRKISKTHRSKSKSEWQGIVARRKATYKEKTGYTNPRQNPEVRKKAEVTYEKRTGYTHNMRNPEHKLARTTNHLAKYGVEHSMQRVDVKAKAVATCMSKYGGLGKGSLDIRDRIEATCMRVYGYPVPTQNLEIMNKCKATWLAKYGFEQPNKNPEQALKGLRTARKLRTINLEGKKFKVQGSYEEELLHILVAKFGASDVFTQFSKTAAKARLRLMVVGVPDFYIKSKDVFVECKSTWTLYGVTNIKPTLEKAEANYGKCIWLVKVDDVWVNLKGRWWESSNLPLRIETSKFKKADGSFRLGFEASVLQYVRTLYPEAKVKNHKIYIKSKLVIDLKTLYYDSTCTQAEDSLKASADKTFKRASELGVRLITVWDYQWHSQKTKVALRGLIKRALTVDSRIHARKCTVLVKKPSELSLWSHHIQGQPKHGTAYCLEYQGEVVAAMVIDTVRSARGSVKSSDVELTRFVTSTSVSGGASKLLSYVLKTLKPKSIVSYSDNANFDGKMYAALGFTKVKSLKPQYSVWWGPKDVRPMQSTTRENLAKNFPEFNSKLTEKANSQLLGLHRIYNAGKIKWLFQN